MTAPMLLCHICSSWRKHALASATLWRYLSYSITLVKASYGNNTESVPVTYEFAERDIEFIRWWKRNQGQISPVLCFNVDRFNQLPGVTLGTQKPRESSEVFILEYITSAQYLDLNVFYWYFLCEHLQAGYPVVFPNLHTVLAESTSTVAFDRLQTLLPAHALPALRRLSIDNQCTLSTHLSTLTHLCLHPSISITFWHSLIRTIPHLQWGYFDIAPGNLPFHIAHDAPSPPQCTHLELTTLSIVVHGRLARNVVFPLSILFTDLHLPALCTLSLASPGIKAWEDKRALSEIYTILNSTPAVMKLALEEQKLDFDARRDMSIALPTIQGAVPIWHHATELAHLQRALPAGIPAGSAEAEEALILLVRSIFSSDSVWLDIQSDACPIRAVTISNNGQLNDISDLTMSSIRESAGKVPKVVLEITSELAIQVAVDVPRDWGSKI